jgi:hypothetical protein
VKDSSKEKKSDNRDSQSRLVLLVQVLLQQECAGFMLMDRTGNDGSALGPCSGHVTPEHWQAVLQQIRQQQPTVGWQANAVPRMIYRVGMPAWSSASSMVQGLLQAAGHLPGTWFGSLYNSTSQLDT